MTEFLVITGLSGAGRSSAADNLEDLGWFVIDNLPAPLFPKILELTTGRDVALDHVALVIGSGPYQEEVVRGIHELRAASGSRVRVLFLDAATDTLVRRYEATRRRHPQAGGESLSEAIEGERALLEGVKAEADVVIDTSDLNVHQLRSRVIELFADGDPDRGMQVTFTSFGYKHGLPLDVDLVFDCRFLPNPHWVDELRPLTGLDTPVRSYVLGHEVAHDFLARLEALFELLLPAYVAEGKAYLTVALGCTGGRHRSVTMVEELAAVVRRSGFVVTVSHRDIDK